MRFYAAAILFLLAVALQFKAILLFRQMMSEVNQALPENSRIPEFGPSWLRARVIKWHRQLFPASIVRKKMYAFWVLEVAAFTCALAFVIRFG